VVARLTKGAHGRAGGRGGRRRDRPAGWTGRISAPSTSWNVRVQIGGPAPPAGTIDKLRKLNTLLRQYGDLG